MSRILKLFKRGNLKKKLELTNFVLEITHQCNHNCLYCYNPWKDRRQHYPTGKELSVDQLRKIIFKLKEETKIRYLAISGGEPLVTDRTIPIIRACSEVKIKTNLITNGSLLDEKTCRQLVEAGIDIFEIPLLTTDSELHYKLTGSRDLAQTTRAVKTIKKHKSKLIIAFVATALNIKCVKETTEFAIASGADGLMFNRFNPGGQGIIHLQELMPSLDDIKNSLLELDRLAGYYGISASASVPIPKCLVNPDNYRHIEFGYCPSGNSKSYHTIDAYGNVRTCNHSPVILGNLLKESFQEIIMNPYVLRFRKAHPKYCTNCEEVTSCWGGCKAAAEVCYGDLSDPDPLLKGIYATW